MNTISNQAGDGRRRRRRKHSAELKAQVVAACCQPGVSMAAVAMAHGVNANLARRWVVEAERCPGADAIALRGSARQAAPSTLAATFVPLQVASNATPADIRIELRRGATTINVSWPSSAATQCSAWLRELLR